MYGIVNHCKVCPCAVYNATLFVRTTSCRAEILPSGGVVRKDVPNLGSPEQSQWYWLKLSSGMRYCIDWMVMFLILPKCNGLCKVGWVVESRFGTFPSWTYHLLKAISTKTGYDYKWGSIVKAERTRFAIIRYNTPLFSNDSRNIRVYKIFQPFVWRLV